MKTLIRQTYAEGEIMGAEWAERDRADSIAHSDEIERLRSESQTDRRWARAFYLGALRGYREVVRSLRDGRWGT